MIHRTAEIVQQPFCNRWALGEILLLLLLAARNDFQRAMRQRPLLLRGLFRCQGGWYCDLPRVWFSGQLSSTLNAERRREAAFGLPG